MAKIFLASTILATVACGGAELAKPEPTVAWRFITGGTATVDAQAPNPIPNTPTPVPPTPTPVPPTPTPTPRPPGTIAPAPFAAAQTYEGIEECGQSFPASVAQWWDTVRQYAWNACSALRIILCESRGDAYAVNASSGACGVMQHLPCQYPGDGPGSISLGFAKYATRGFQPWNVGGCYG